MAARKFVDYLLKTYNIKKMSSYSLCDEDFDSEEDGPTATQQSQVWKKHNYIMLTTISLANSNDQIGDL